MEQQIELKRDKVFFPNLDGLRFFAFFAVLLRHSGTTDFTYIKANSVYIIVKKYFFMNGLLGVNFFFVLSGFLITYLLLDEKSVFKKISIRSFYMRRILRIWPVYYMVLLIGFVIIPMVKAYFNNLEVVDANPWYYIAFLGNFYSVYIHPPNSPMLDRLWSIAAEEQFYLLWPLVIAWVPVKKLPLVFGFLLASSLIFRLLNNNQSEIILFHPLASVSDLVIGSWAAYLIFYSIKVKAYFENMPRWQVIIIYIITFAVLCFYKLILKQVEYRYATQMLFGLLFAFIILEQNYCHNSIFKLSNFKWVSRWGVWTYGLYCYHALGIYMALYVSRKLHLNTTVFEVLVVNTILSLIFSLMISWFSYKYFETPFLRLKSKWQKIKAH